MNKYKVSHYKNFFNRGKAKVYFIFKNITTINHEPHPYCIGARHITHASDNYGGILDNETIKSLEDSKSKGCCAVSGCELRYKQHTYDTVLFLSLKRNVKNKIASEILNKITKKMKAEGIDGFCFVETKEKFRILPKPIDTKAKP